MEDDAFVVGTAGWRGHTCMLPIIFDAKSAFQQSNEYEIMCFIMLVILFTWVDEPTLQDHSVIQAQTSVLTQLGD